MQFQLDGTPFATTVTSADGTRFHPAVQHAGPISRPYAWEHVTYATENKAYAHACQALGEAIEAFNFVSRKWSVIRL